MAFCTIEVSAVIQRFVGESGMAVDSRCPCLWDMTQTAVLGRVEVSRIHASRGYPVMTRCARTDDLIVIDSGHRRPDRGAVTILADIGGQRVQWVLARRIGAVVTTKAIVDDIGVIEIRWRPRNGGMAVIAIVSTRDMRWVFSGRGDTVVAGATGTKYWACGSLRTRW